MGHQLRAMPTSLHVQEVLAVLVVVVQPLEGSFINKDSNFCIDLYFTEKLFT